MAYVEDIIYEMLTENTGKHFLDSGDHYGRNWERNGKFTIADFRKRNPVKYEVSGLSDPDRSIYIERTLDVFQYLAGSSSNLYYDEITSRFNYITKHSQAAHAEIYDAYGVRSDAWSWLTERHDVEIQRCWNTYNGDSDLSQILQGSNLLINGEPYLLLQTHNGCDARGGYSDARLFVYSSGYDDFINEQFMEWEDDEQRYDAVVRYDHEFFDEDNDRTICFSELNEHEKERLEKV